MDVVCIVSGGLPRPHIGAVLAREALDELIGDLPPFPIGKHPVGVRVGQRDPVHPPFALGGRTIPATLAVLALGALHGVLVRRDETLHGVRAYPPVPARNVSGHPMRIDMLISAPRPMVIGQRLRRVTSVRDLRNHRPFTAWP
ncbi:Uncharacterised protein [Mycobacteroides abscessus subsp. abscessus]|nr:Uncharacterised protein [Mycobacteroides abscessus subsp. abscessus]